jgi:hypothetical protein
MPASFFRERTKKEHQEKICTCNLKLNLKLNLKNSSGTIRASDP